MTARILFVGDLGRDSYLSGQSRSDALRAQGHTVQEFTTLGWGGTTPLRYRLNHRLFLGPRVRDLNRRLQDAVAGAKPDVVWVDKGLWIYPRTMASMRRHAGLVLHYSTDDVLMKASQNWLHRRVLSHYGLYLTTNRFNVTELRERYGVRTCRAGMGYDERVHDPGSTDGPGSTDPHIVFIGHWEPTTEDVVTALRDAGLPIRVWGANWNRAKRPQWRETKMLSHGQYNDTVRRAGVALCCLSKWGRNESTGRSFEIPALGAVLLAERTAEHEYLYGDGTEAVLFSDTAELTARARDLLADPARIRKIARAGQERCRSLGLSWADHLGREWPVVQRALEGSWRLLPEDDDPFWPGFRAGAPFEPARR